MAKDSHTLVCLMVLFLVASDDDYVYKHACLDRVPLFRVMDIPQEESFLRCCRSSGNLESLYIQGTEDYFLDHELYKKGFGMVRVAAQKGNKRSMYALAIIVLMASDASEGFGLEELEEALGYLRFLRNHKCVLRCRKEVAELATWLSGGMYFDLEIMQRGFLCSNDPCKNKWRPRIGSEFLETEDDDENDPNMCEDCRWDHEVVESYEECGIVLKNFRKSAVLH